MFTHDASIGTVTVHTTQEFHFPLLGVFAFERMLSNFHVLDVFVEACEGRIPTVAENVSSVCRKWWDA